jgi:type II protein arginine methyltransferase
LQQRELEMTHAPITRIDGSTTALVRPDHVEALLESVDQLIGEGRYDLSYNLLKRLRGVLGESSQINRRLGRINRAWVPRWHFAMLNDDARNHAFAQAIAHSNVRDKVVLDIGAGSGLLSMLAAKQGARHVYACEMVAPVADKAIEIIAANGYSDQVTLIPKISYDLQVGRDLPRRADVLVSETIDCGFVGEGFLGSLRHARAELLTPEAAIVPRRFTLEGALLNSTDVYNLNRTHEVEGLNLSGFNELSTQGYFPVRLDTWQYRMASDVTRLLALDLADYNFTPISELLELTATEDGLVHGVVFWFDVELVPGVRLSNAPRGSSHWMQAFACFDWPVAVKAGDEIVVQLDFSHGAVELSYLGNRSAARQTGS